jgi:hypothetical protein
MHLKKNLPSCTLPLFPARGKLNAFHCIPQATEVHMPNNKVTFSSSACRAWFISAFIVAMFSCTQHREAEIVPAAQPAPQTEIERQLEQARSDLSVSQATEERITSELKALKESGKATPEMVKDYEIYLSRVQSMVAEKKKIAEDMEKAYARHQEMEKSGNYSKSTTPAGAPPPATSPPPAMAPGQESGELGTLDRELSASLSEFDQLLLKEMDEIRSKSESRMSTLAQEAASAAQRIGEQGEEAGGTSGEPASSEGGEKGGQKGSEGESGGSYENVPTTDGPVAGGSSAGGSASGQQAKRPSGSDQDDDIVARQLREAAEKETDPELKKKLWKEYEDYKKSTRQ